VEVARPSGWTLAGIAIAAIVAGPLLALPLSFVGQPDAFDQIAATLLPDALRASLVLAAGVGVGTLVLGGGLAALVSFFDFPGRRLLEWALVLPMAMPAYVLVFVLLGQYDEAGPLQRGLRDALGIQLPDVRSTLGTIAVLTLVLYPYVYVLGRSAFLGQSRQALEAARTLGLSHAAAVRRVALPLARPALAGGVALAVMEALADFGAVNLLNYRALTDAIYRVWFGTFDQAAALQLATVLVSLTFTLVVLERLLRGRARYQQALAHGDAVIPRRLRGPAAWLATAGPVLLLIVVVAAPLVQLVAWAVSSLGDGASAEALVRAAVNSLLLASIAAVVAVVCATVVAYGPRAHPSRPGAAAARVSALGYAVPGTVVAVAVYVPLSWLDGRIDDLTGAGLLITGTAAGLILAYVVRFNALALFAVQTRMGRIDPALDEAARGLGADRTRLLAEIHLPLLWPGIATAALLVFVEVMKELPATALLRPLGGDTLAIAVWEATKDSRFETAALPALLIVAVGLVPVVLAIRLSHGTPALPAPERTGVDELVHAP
jgi:iron(III) transport system permease protein